MGVPKHLQAAYVNLPWVEFVTGGGSQIALAGDFVGRTPSAAVWLKDPMVSEAHALVSIRDDALKLLALRGRLRLNGEWTAVIALAPGQRIELSPTSTLLVAAVQVPTELWVVTVNDTMSVPLQVPITWSAASGWSSRPNPSGTLHFWSEGDRWVYRDRTMDEPQRVAAGVHPFADGTFVVETSPLTARSQNTATPHRYTALRIVNEYDLIRFQDANGSIGVLSGLGARLLAELLTLRTAEWRMLTELLWGSASAKGRTRLDTLVWRTRRRLKALGITRDLLRADGNGSFYLDLGPEDHVVDNS